MPDEPLRATQLTFDPIPVGIGLRPAAKNGLLGGSKLHGDMKPIQNPAARQSTALDGGGKFPVSVADYGDTLVPADPTLPKEVIESPGAGLYAFADVGIDAGGAIGQCGAARSDIDLLAVGARRLAMFQPARIDANCGHLSRFTRMFGIAEKWPSRHVLLNLSIDLIASNANSMTGATGGDTGFQRQFMRSGLIDTCRLDAGTAVAVGE